MRHFEDYEIEHLLNSTGGFLLRLRCKIHLKNCAVCRKRMENLMNDRYFLRQLRTGLKRMEEETAAGKGRLSGELK